MQDFMQENRILMRSKIIGGRIALLRRELGMTQAELAEKLSFNHRQTLQSIETGERRLTIAELMKLVEIGNRPVEYFTDPFHWTGEGRFSFRADGVPEKAITEFEQTAGGWIMLWRWLSSINDLRATSRPRLEIGKGSSFEDVAIIAARIVTWFDLGAVPALTLAERLESELLIPVLFVDLPVGISGATYHHEGMNVILINRKDSDGRRNFDLAHEFFHALTWDVLPPGRYDNDHPADRSAKRREQLANGFASALLLPEQNVRKYWKRKSFASADAVSRAKSAVQGAEHFHVSTQAFLWRLVALELLSEQECRDALSIAERATTSSVHTRLRSPVLSRFMLIQLGIALDDGRISVRRAASVLGLDIDSLAEAFESHDLQVPFDL
jgi:Zn-dependent peptidase ImmA (M78 family)/transcriptional regulator with XRE-family HTH domain